MSQELAHRVISRRSSNPVAFGAKRTSQFRLSDAGASRKLAFLPTLAPAARSSRRLDRDVDPAAERAERSLDLVEARGMVEPKQAVDRFPLPAQAAHQLGARDARLAQ